MCVCVCERERQRQRDRETYFLLSLCLSDSQTINTSRTSGCTPRTYAPAAERCPSQLSLLSVPFLIGARLRDPM